MTLVLCYIGLIFFVVAIARRAMTMAKMPVHLRWELAPVPHEKGRAHYGGSYLEEVDWWTKPREKSVADEAIYMFKEIVLLRGVWEHNPGLWLFSFPFHFGLYLVFATYGCLLLATLGVPLFDQLTYWLAAAGFVLGTIGSLGLFCKRALDPKLSAFTNPATYINLASVAAIFVTGLAAVFTTEFPASMVVFVKAFFSGNTEAPLAPAVSAHILFLTLFLVYLPFTHMTHFIAKYFTYHEIRWNDEPMKDNDALQEEVKAMLSQPVAWAAPHVGADGQKNWVDIATADMSKKAKDAEKE